MTPTLIALTLFIAWAIGLLLLMEFLRVKLVATKTVAPNAFLPDNSNLSPFMQRLARAHANCIESLPLFGGLMLVAVAAGKSEVTDSLAYVLVAARIVQSTAHLAALSVVAVNIRFLAFLVQLGIAIHWAVRLLVASAQ
jgi:uncharacterized MAPEG superfamily protein